MERKIDINNVMLDGMMGLVVGDALGNPVQFMSRDAIPARAKGPVTGMEAGGVFGMPAGSFTDDGSMALATLRSILDKGEIVPEDIMDNFVAWEFEGKFTPFGEAYDEGNTCSSAIWDYRIYKEKCAKEAEKNGADSVFGGANEFKYFGAAGEYANGNGALMRILPVCIFFAKRASSVCTSDDFAIEAIHNVTALTHNTLRAKMANGLYYFMVKSIIYGQGSLKERLQKGLDDGFAYYGHDLRNLGERMHFSRMFSLEEFAKVPEDEIKSSGYVIHTFEAAIWCLIHGESFRESLLKAVNLGDDADTVGAVAGGLAGLYYGYEGIPAEWIEAMQRREWIEAMCRE